MRYMRDITGPNVGQIREHFDHVAEHLKATGQAVDATEAEVAEWFGIEQPEAVLPPATPEVPLGPQAPAAPPASTAPAPRRRGRRG